MAQAAARLRPRIRVATPADAGAIHAALLGIAETVNEVQKVKSTPQDILAHGFGDRAAFTTLIAEIESEFAGMCLFFPAFSTWLGKRGGYVQDLFVAERYRGLGIAEALLRETAAAVRNRGGGYLSLAVDRGNFRAQRFYERIGFETSDTDLHCMAAGENFRALADAAAEEGV